LVKIENGITQVISRLSLRLHLKTRKGVVLVTGEVRLSKKGGILHLLVKDGIAKVGEKQRYLSYGEGTRVIPNIILL